MKTKFLPTRSGDGTFILEFVPRQYTLFALSFSGQFVVLSDWRLTSGPARIYRHGAQIEGRVASMPKRRED